MRQSVNISGKIYSKACKKFNFRIMICLSQVKYSFS
jgi:hypothetical protein